jgi:outer membrane murein-binding lipoprotein Lpp
MVTMGYAMSHPSLTIVTAAAVSALLLAGCGTSADRRQARAAAERFATAVQAGDGATACAQLSPALRRQLVKDEPGKRCAKAVLGLSVHGRRASAVRVYATSAEVELAGGDTLFLDDTSEGWRLQAVGCHPNGDGPYECEEQA